MVVRAPIDDAEFGPLLPLASEPSIGNRRSIGTRAVAVGGGAVLLASALIYSSPGAKPSGASVLGALILLIVAALALRRGYRLLWGAGLPQFYERGLIDRRRRVPYRD